MTTYFFGVATRSYQFEATIGRAEFSGPGFRTPSDLALAPNGVIYIPNRSWEYRPDGVRVTMLTIDEEFVGEFSRAGEGDGELMWPSSIALDRDQNVYVSDDLLNRISVFDKDGVFLSKWGVSGTGEGQLNKPSGIRFDSDDNLYVVNGGNNRVQKFTRDGAFLLGWGESGNGEGQFNHPWGLAIDDHGDVYVADWRNDRVQKFSPDGGYLAEFGTSGSGVAEFCRPAGVAVDKDGDVYVADWGNNRVQVFTSEGKFVTEITGDAGLSKWGAEKIKSNPDMVRQRSLVRDFSQERDLWRPTTVAIDSEGRIIILDCNRHRLQVYRKSPY